MEFRQINYFIALIEEGTVTRAAHRMNIVQPALSMQIARLEEQVGQRLFERTKQGMVPTAAGRQMYKLFLPIMRDFSSAYAQMQSSDGIHGHISIGLVASVTEGVLVDTLSEFSSRYPEVSVSVADGYTGALIDRVTAGRLDAAIINKPRRPLALDVEYIVDEEMILITGAALGTGANAGVPDSLSLRELIALDLPLVLPTRGHGLRATIDSFAESEGIELQPRFELDLLVATIMLVERSRVATIVPRVAVHRELDEGTLRAHTITSPRLVRRMVGVSHPRRPLSPAAQLFMAMLAANLKLRSPGGGDAPAPEPEPAT
ncbi:LysR family transcriptional regulator [Telluria mixta]|uniref:LysR family transcriptional regulator n=1 Tax=Telluria mixta TaxID=34071 RepID=A0ABT2C491_9BURK|nr:LysR family transcriptional regulator [Telluria mixta]MCS0632212.1 LysR family transcriptional regulator [Telluria mixta]WEM95025.1 LysR family transcriptional regulator [Telluria mixta]